MGRSDSGVVSLQAAKRGHSKARDPGSGGGKDSEVSSPRKTVSGERVSQLLALVRSVQPGNLLSPTLLFALV